MNTGPYEGLTIEMADERGGPTRQVELAEVVVRAERAAQSGDQHLAFEIIYEAADLVEAMGIPQATLALLDDLRRTVPDRSISLTDRAWLHNLEGRAFGDLGRSQDAIKAFRTMAEIGEQSDDPDIAATAAHNLGVEARLAGNAIEAEQYFRTALVGKEAIGDRRAIAQLRLNLVGLAIDQGALDTATEQLTDAERAVKRARDPSLRASLHGNRGLLAVARGDLVKARRSFRHALRWAYSRGSVASMVRSAQNLGSVELDLDRPDEAIQWYRRALELATTAQLLALEVDSRRGLALALHKADRDPEAVEELSRVIELADSRGDALARAKANADLGALAITNGELNRAIELLAEALAEFRQVEDRDWEVRTLANLVTASAADGNAYLAARYANEAMAILPSQARDRSTLLERVGHAWLAAGNATRAAEALEQSLDEMKQTNHDGLAWETLQAAALLAGQGHNGEAIPFYDRAFALYEVDRNPQMAFHIRNDRAIAFTTLDLFTEAREDFEACIELANRFDDRAMALQACSNFGEMTRREGNTNEAIALLERSIWLAKSLGDEASEANAWANLGLAHRDAGLTDKAKESHQKALELSRRSKDIYSESTALGGLAGVAFTEGDYETAASLYREASELQLAPDGQIHIVEDLAALTESLSALGRVDETSEAAQRLVDLAQELGETDFAAEGLSRSAVRWINMNRTEEAVSLLAAAAKVATANPAYGDEEAIRAVARSIMSIVAKIDTVIVDETERTRILGALVESASDGDEEVAAFLRNTIATAQEALADQSKTERVTTETPVTLSQLEIEVLRLLVEGQRDATIAHNLDLSLRTVSEQIEDLLEKYDLPNRTELAAYAVHHGLI